MKATCSVCSSVRTISKRLRNENSQPPGARSSAAKKWTSPSPTSITQLSPTQDWSHLPSVETAVSTKLWGMYGRNMSVLSLKAFQRVSSKKWSPMSPFYKLAQLTNLYLSHARKTCSNSYKRSYRPSQTDSWLCWVCQGSGNQALPVRLSSTSTNAICCQAATFFWTRAASKTAKSSWGLSTTK